MNTPEEIAAAIEKLPLAQQRGLANWLQEHLADAWDRQIEEDSRAGRLDFLLQESQRGTDKEKDVPLEQFLDETEP